jgi:glycosyltransferase involved in cell wall biosynthesis
LVATLRQTDFYVIKYRPDLIPCYREIIKQCRILFFLVPNMLLLLKKVFGKQFFDQHIKGKTQFLPNIIEPVKTMQGVDPEKNRLLTVVRMTRKSVQRKNVKRLFKAVNLIKDLDLRLWVVGGGDYLEKVVALAQRYEISRRVTFCGAVPNSQLTEYYGRAQAFVLPSSSESFGMTYAEALRCGTPIVYSSKVLGFENIFNNVGVGVNPKSVASIAAGIRRIMEANDFYRNSIAQLQAQNQLDIFSAAAVSGTYMTCMNRLLAN